MRRAPRGEKPEGPGRPGLGGARRRRRFAGGILAVTLLWSSPLLAAKEGGARETGGKAEAAKEAGGKAEAAKEEAAKKREEGRAGTGRKEGAGKEALRKEGAGKESGRKENRLDEEIGEQKKELEALKAALEKEKAELEKMLERQTGMQQKTEKIAANLAMTERYLDELKKTDALLARSVAETESTLTALENRIEDRNRVMARRVRALYMTGKVDPLFLGYTPPDREGRYLRKVIFLRRILRRDRQLLSESRADLTLRRETAARLKSKKEEVGRFTLRRNREMAELARGKREHEAALSELQQNVTAKNEALRTLEENAEKLTAILRALEKRRRENLAQNKKGRVLESAESYCRPLTGEITSRYGLHYHALLKTQTRNLGVEIQGRPGAPVRAAVSGEVALITAIPGYGPGLILDNGSGYFTIYANLGEIKVRKGEKVKTCEEIAALPGQAAYRNRLYFEVRKGTKTLDPEKWLAGGGP